MTYTLSQYAKLEKNPLSKGLMLGLIQESVVGDILTWRNINGMSESGVRYDSVPTPAYIPLDGTISEATVDGHQINHSVYRMAHHIDIPVPLEDLTRDLLAKPSTQQIKLALRGAAYVLNDKFINGDQGTDPNGFDGINKFVGNLASRQTVNSTEIDLTASYTSATSQTLLNAVHQAMYVVDGHKPDAAFANETFLLKFEEVLRREQLLGNDFNWTTRSLMTSNQRTTDRTASSEPAMMYRGVPFYDVGTKGDQTTKIIGDTYTEGGSTAHGTRVFFVKFGEDNLEGLQADPLQVRPIGLLESKDNYRWRLTWTHGLALWGPRSISKLQGIRAV